MKTPKTHPRRARIALAATLAATFALIALTSCAKTSRKTITAPADAAASVAVSPASAMLAQGGTASLTATPKDASGTALAGRVVTWASDNTAAATVNGSGLVTTVAAGSATITATCEGQTGTSAITVTPAIPGGSIPSQIFPLDNVWNTDITNVPVHPMSATWIAKVSEHGGTDNFLWPGWKYPNYGFKYQLVDKTTPRVKMKIVQQSAADSDTGIYYPFGPNTPLEVGTADYRAFMISTDTDTLYEMYLANWNNGDPQARQACAWNIKSNALRPDNRSSADEAGLALFVGVVRWDEVQKGVINHAFRFENTSEHIDGSYHLWPGRHSGGTGGSDCPPMGARMRLKASYVPPATFHAGTLVIVRALQHYGMFLSDIGLNWEMQGTCDPSWDPGVMTDLFQIPASQFEFVDESGLIVNPNSGQAFQLGPRKSQP